MTKFEAWLKAAEPGERLVYHEGTFLRQGGMTVQARKAFNRGEVELVQERLMHPVSTNKCGVFAWIAVKKRWPEKPIAALIFTDEFIGGSVA